MERVQFFEGDLISEDENVCSECCNRGFIKGGRKGEND
jgi:hypothetical protein